MDTGDKGDKYKEPCRDAGLFYEYACLECGLYLFIEGQNMIDPFGFVLDG